METRRLVENQTYLLDVNGNEIRVWYSSKSDFIVRVSDGELGPFWTFYDCKMNEMHNLTEEEVREKVSKLPEAVVR